MLDLAKTVIKKRMKLFNLYLKQPVCAVCVSFVGEINRGS